MRRAAKNEIVGEWWNAVLVDGASPIAYGYDEKSRHTATMGYFFVEQRCRRASAQAFGADMKQRQPGAERRRSGFCQSTRRSGSTARTGIGSGEFPPLTPEQNAQQCAGDSTGESCARRAAICECERFADFRIVDGAERLAQHPACWMCRSDRTRRAVFDYPVYRGETRGTYSLVLIPC